MNLVKQVTSVENTNKTVPSNALFFQPKLSANQPGDIYEQEADAVADKILQPQSINNSNTFFKPVAPAGIIQRQGNDKKKEADHELPNQFTPSEPETDAVSGGLSSVADNLSSNNPQFSLLADQLKLKLWDNQPTEFKGGIIAFAGSTLALTYSALGISLFSQQRNSLSNTFEDVNIAAPLSIIPYVPIHSFKYKFPTAGNNNYQLSGEVDVSDYLDLLHENYSWFPQMEASFGLNMNLNAATGSVAVTGGMFNVKLLGGGITLSGGVNQQFAPPPQMFFPGEANASPVSVMNEIPGGSFSRDTRFGLTVDVPNLIDFFSPPKRRPAVSPKLSVNQPGDIYEQEADAMADRVMKMDIPEHGNNMEIQRKCATCEEEEKLHRKEKTEPNIADSASTQLENYIGGLRSAGANLPKETKSFFEPRMGYDFSSVKIHTGAVAAKSADSINALAYTSGNNIVFNEGQFSPATETGKKLLAHELTHVIQQQPAQHLKRTPVKPTRVFQGICEIYEDLELELVIQPKAKDLVDAAVSKLDDFISGGNKNVAAALMSNFSSAEAVTASKVREIFKMIAAELAVTGKYQCRDDETERVAYSYGEPPITIEPLFWTYTPIEKALVIIHEYAHFHSFQLASSSEKDGISDQAYVFQRFAPFLSTNESLLNAASYASFVRQLLVTGWPSTNVIEDDFLHCKNKDDRAKISKALIEIEKRNMSLITELDQNPVRLDIWSQPRIDELGEDSPQLIIALRNMLKPVEKMLNNPIHIVCSDDSGLNAYASHAADAIMINPANELDTEWNIVPLYASLYIALIGMVTSNVRYRNKIPALAARIFRFDGIVPSDDKNIEPNVESASEDKNPELQQQLQMKEYTSKGNYLPDSSFKKQNNNIVQTKLSDSKSTYPGNTG